MGREVLIKPPVSRIVSLVPSQTELLHFLGLGKNVVGRTKFCIHPENGFPNSEIIGGSKQFHVSKIEKLQPDLIIGNKEENDKKLISDLEKKHPVWLSDIQDFDFAMSMITSLSEVFEKSDLGASLVERINSRFNQIEPFNSLRVLYLIWKKPYMGVGRDTFINAILEKIGLKNTLEYHSRYPKLSVNQMVKYEPDLVFLSSEPFPFKSKDCKELESLLPKSRVILVDGEYFSWYGSRLLHAPEYLQALRKELFK